MCFLGWAWELLGTMTFLIVPVQSYFGLTYLHCFDAMMTFILIPIVYITNDEETKRIISDQGWNMGMRHMMGIKHTNVSMNNNSDDQI